MAKSDEIKKVTITLKSGRVMGCGLDKAGISILRETINLAKKQGYDIMRDIVKMQPKDCRDDNEQYWVDLSQVENFLVQTLEEEKLITVPEKPKLSL